jgi:hypothetical protein
MNTNDAFRIGFRPLILVALTAVAVACGASHDDPNTVDQQSLTEPAGDSSDPDAAAPVRREAPAQPPSLTPDDDNAPRDNGPGAPSGDGYVPPNHPHGGQTRS